VLPKGENMSKVKIPIYLGICYWSVALLAAIGIAYEDKIIHLTHKLRRKT
jgi:hypothetical protein